MGRRNFPAGVPQRSRLEANREVRRAVRDQELHTFGIRRYVEPSQQMDMIAHLRHLQDNDDIPESVKLRKKLNATLLPARTLGRQAMQGFLLGQTIARMDARIQSEMDKPQTKFLEVLRGPVEVYKGQRIYMQFESPEFDEEMEELHELLGYFGVKGYTGKFKKMGKHISLGEARGGMTRTEQNHVKHMIEEVLPHPGDVISLEPWDIYYPGSKPDR